MTLRLKHVHKDVFGFRATHKFGESQFEVICIPPSKDQRWDLDSLLRDKIQSEWLGELLRGLGVKRVYTPAVGAASATVVRQEFFSNSRELDLGVRLYNAPTSPVDGASLRLGGDAIAFAGAGCKLLVAVGPHSLVAAHAAFRSLFDITEVQTGTPSRTHTSVIEAMRDRIESHGDSVRNTMIFGFFGIPSKHLEYPFIDSEDHTLFQKYAIDKGWGKDCILHENNSAHPDLDMITVNQAKHYGFVRKASNQNALPRDDVYANTRHTDPELRTARNLVLCIRRR